MMLSLLPWLFDLGCHLPYLTKALLQSSGMDKETYLRTVAQLQARIQRLEENLENSRLESEQKNAMLQALRRLCVEKDDELQRDIDEVNEIRKDFEELKRLSAQRCRRKSCVIM
uniref:CUB domain containing protein n=1 Tax=Rhipicephalus appendiculatus TaxID=34631 RepID=A0A131YTP1_RHIAP